MKNRFLLIPLVTIVAGLAVVAVPRFQEAKDQLSAKQALALVRTLNSSEATMKLKDSSYGSLRDVMKLERLDQRYGFDWVDNSSATVKDYRLSVVTAADGKHYQISLHPSSGCGVSFFSNESGVIYQGNALGCSTP
jgi:hypothetical protein